MVGESARQHPLAAVPVSTDPFDLQLRNSAKFGVSGNEGTRIFLRQGGGEGVCIGNRETALEERGIPNVVEGGDFDGYGESG